MLHRSGVPVTVPAPERYAVHKLIVASRRRSDANGSAKREKDVQQARLLIEALEQTRSRDDLAEAFAEAWRRGPHWRHAIKTGLYLMPEKHLEAVTTILRDGLSSIGETLEGFGGGERA